MKTNAARNSGLAQLGLVALTVYILACTSFSPDDKKVLYPSMDPQSGRVGIAVYDRESSRSKMVFMPATYEGTNSANQPLLRAQWLANGREILVSWIEEQGDNDTFLAILPFGSDGPARQFRFRSHEDNCHLVLPLPVSGPYVFLQSEKDIVKLNTRDGSIERRPVKAEQSEFAIYPGFSEGSLFFVRREEATDIYKFGRFDPKTFQETPVLTFTNQPGDTGLFTYDERGSRLAFSQGVGDDEKLIVFESGKPPFTRVIATDEPIRFGNGILLSSKNEVVATYMQQGTNTASFGIVEIPLNANPVRKTVLIARGPTMSQEALLAFQVAISHDGRTAAACSTYLAREEKDFKADDCALFLVDLSSAERKVKKVPIPLPKK